MEPGHDRSDLVVALVGVEVNGQAWTRVGDLGQSGPEDQHYVVRLDAEGGARVEFGDGRHGRRIPAGATVTARYARGSGRRSDSFAVTLDRTERPSTPDQPLWVTVRDRGDGVAVTLHRTETPSTPDQPLWVVVRDRDDQVSFAHSPRDPEAIPPRPVGERGMWWKALATLLFLLLLLCLAGVIHWPR